MNGRQPLVAALSLLVFVALLAPLAAAGTSWPAAGTRAPELNLSDPGSTGSLPVHPIAQTIWETTDGPVSRLEVARGWLLGPAPLAMTVEHYDDSPSGTRQLVYFDKGRLDILDINAPVGDPWAAPGGQLVTELLGGAIQLGANRWVRRAPAEIPVSGDPEQPNGVTYATLGAVATLPHGVRDGQSAPDAEPRIGDEVTAVLKSDGSVDESGQADGAVTIATYDEVTLHNIAEPFQAWSESQVYEWLYVLGRPLTEPYWVDTVVAGTATRVLVQAFERRVLSYTPDNSPGWQTESGNVGKHYRAWRGLSRAVDPALAPLVASVPFGEEIVAAATATRVDPYLLAALAEVASSGDPFAASGESRGLLGVRSAIAPASDDPAANALVGAHELARLLGEMGDERAALAAYYAGDGDPTAFAERVLATRDQLLGRQGRAMATTTATTQPLAEVASGSAGIFPDGFDSGWWGRQLAWTAGWGGALDSWAVDPHGYYCVSAGYSTGDRLRLVANDVSIDCTIGGEAGRPNMPAVGEGVVTLNRAAFDALGLGNKNSLRVYHLGPASGQPTGAATQINAGPAAFYDAGYDTGWWESTLHRYAGWGGTAAGWAIDPNGFYCVHPDYIPGQRLRLIANGVTLDCTIGDTVQPHHVALWQSRWAVELSWNTFAALGLEGSNSVEVYAVLEG